MDNYSKIRNYDFSDTVVGDKVVVKFKIKNNITPYDFITMFKNRKGERFSIKRPNSREIIVGIGHEYTWNLDSNHFLENYDNISILEEFESLLNQVTVVEIDELEDDYFGVYGGISDGENKKSQEWIDFSDTIFVIPNILAVFKENFIEFTLFFKIKKDKDFVTRFKEATHFLLQIDEYNKLDLQEPHIKIVREIYPEAWQDNIKQALKQIEEEKFTRIALTRKNQIVLEEHMSLPAVVKYFMAKKLSFIAFESRKSMFVTSNPLLSLKTNSDEVNAYLYLQKESLFNGIRSIDFSEKDIEDNYKIKLEEKTGYKFEIFKDKTLVGKNLDVYSTFRAKSDGKIQDIKILSLLYPISIIKGYPYEETTKFLLEKENVSYGFFYAPFGFINSNFEANFYTCANMVVAFGNIITMFTTILVNKEMSYEQIIENSNILTEKNLKLFKNESN